MQKVDQLIKVMTVGTVMVTLVLVYVFRLI